MACGRTKKAIAILGNGHQTQPMDTVFTNGKMETVMKVSGDIPCDMARAKTNFLMVIILLVSIFTVSLKVMVSISGRTVTHLAVNSKRARNMAMEYGKSHQPIQILTFTRVNISKI